MFGCGKVERKCLAHAYLKCIVQSREKNGHETKCSWNLIAS